MFDEDYISPRSTSSKSRSTRRPAKRAFEARHQLIKRSRTYTRAFRAEEHLQDKELIPLTAEEERRQELIHLQFVKSSYFQLELEWRMKNRFEYPTVKDRRIICLP